MRIGALTTIEAGRPALLQQFIHHYSRWCNPADIHIIVRGLCCDTELQQKLTEKVFQWDGWHFNVDSDEFFDRNVDVPALCARMEHNGYNHCKARMIDMFSPLGMPPIPQLTESDIHDVFTERRSVTAAHGGAYDIKVCLLRNPLYGHHGIYSPPPGFVSSPFPFTMDLLHFKWDETCLQRLRNRTDESNRERFPYWQSFDGMIRYLESLDNQSRQTEATAQMTNLNEAQESK